MPADDGDVLFTDKDIALLTDVPFLEMLRINYDINQRQTAHLFKLFFKVLLKNGDIALLFDKNKMRLAVFLEKLLDFV